MICRVMPAMSEGSPPPRCWSPVRNQFQHFLPTCRELGIGITAYGVLSRGLISGHWQKGSGGEKDFRGMSPRFQGENLDHNLALVERLRAIASRVGASVAQVAIA
jgi:aryl-alcohol dehydrogenase-like predicted oxidoreductase